MTQIATLPTPCHTPTTFLVAYALFSGLVSSQEELMDAVGSTDNVVLEDDFGGSPHPQMAVL